jgi:hypothetical protein
MPLKRIAVMLAFVSLVLVACGGSGGGIDEITSVPEGAVNATATSTAPVVASAPQNDESAERENEVLAEPTSTPAPLDNNLAVGKAREIAQATDVAYQPTPRSEVVFNDYPVDLTFNEFYDGFNMRTGLVLSDKLVSLDGDTVVMEGYVAPPLKPEIDFFVLTSIPLASCPFCSTAADWPDDIALVYLPESEVIYSPYPVRVTGKLEVGSSVDAESGMVSLVRIYAEDMEILE